MTTVINSQKHRSSGQFDKLGTGKSGRISAMALLWFIAISSGVSATTFAPMARAENETTVSDQQECTLPFCDLDASLEEFRALRGPRQALYVELYINDYRDNQSQSVADNLLAFATRASAAITPTAQGATIAPETEAALRQLKALANQSHEQLAKISDLNGDDFMTHFTALTSAESRYRVIRYWGERISSVATQRTQAERLRQFFTQAQTTAASSQDPAYVAAEATRFITASNRRIVELSPSNAQQNAIALPFADVAAEANSFQQMAPAEKFLRLRALTEQNMQTTNIAALTSLFSFVEAVRPQLQSGDDSIIMARNQLSALSQQTLAQITHSPALNVEQMVQYLMQVTGTDGRIQVVVDWSNAIQQITDTTLLRKLVQFFPAAQDAIQRSLTAPAAIDMETATDDEKTTFSRRTAEYNATRGWITREAERGVTRSYARIIELSQAPSFAVPVANIAQARELFAAMDIPERFLLIKKLREDYANSDNKQALLSISSFGRNVRELVTAAGTSQNAILRELDLLLTQTHGQLVIRTDLTAQEMAQYYGLLESSALRFQNITHWRGRLAQLNDRAFVTKLVRFFQLCYTVSFNREDPDYVIREAQIAGARARERLTQLSGAQNSAASAQPASGTTETAGSAGQ